MSVLLDVEPEREGVPEEERGGERAEETLEGGGTVFGDDANVILGVCQSVGLLVDGGKKRGKEELFHSSNERVDIQSVCCRPERGMRMSVVDWRVIRSVSCTVMATSSMVC